MNPQDILEHVLADQPLSGAQAREVMETMLRGEAAPEWIAGFLVAMRRKGESPDEIAGFAQAMRTHATKVPCESRPLVDTCGTGGDGAHTFNISTGSAFVVAAAGAHVAKHGNRSVSSRCGSADVLEALGTNLALTPVQVGRSVDEVGLGFLFAPALHGAMKYAVGPRRALSVRTVFNLLGPLTNPAGAQHQVMGVFDAAWLDPIAEVMQRLGNHRSLVVHGEDGLDELTVAAATSVRVVDREGIDRLQIHPEDVGLRMHPAEALAGGDADENALILRNVFDGEPGAPRDVVVLNAGAALWACGQAETLAEGVTQGQAAIDDGRARAMLDRFVAFSHSPEPPS